METFEAFINNLKHIYEIDKHVHLMELPSYDKFIKKAGHHSIVFGMLDCGSEGLGFESHQGHGFFSPGRLLPRDGSAMGPMAILELHSQALSTSRMHLLERCSNYLTNTAGATVPGPG